MNTAQVQKILIDLGLSFEKRQVEGFESGKWFALDEDCVPLASAKVLSEVIWTVERQIGGVV